jgi:hypothetical protein
MNMRHWVVRDSTDRLHHITGVHFDVFDDGDTRFWGTPDNERELVASFTKPISVTPETPGGENIGGALTR